MEFKYSEKNLTGNKWTLSKLKGISTEDFCNWDNIGGLTYDGYAYLVLEKCVNYEKDIWFELVKAMCRKNQSFFKDHLKYIRNDIVNTFRVRILRYAKRIQYMQNLLNLMPLPSMKLYGY